MAIVPDTFLIPYYRAIPLGFDPESWVMLEGSIPPRSKGFYVDFAYGQFRGADIALRFRLSFEGPPSSSSAIIAFNTFTKGQWGKEKRVPAHIRQGQNFTLKIKVTSRGYEVELKQMRESDKFLHDFDHRIPAKRVGFLEIKGDIKLENLKFSWESTGRRRSLL